MSGDSPDSRDTVAPALADTFEAGAQTWSDDAARHVSVGSHPSIGLEQAGRYAPVAGEELGRGGIGRVLVAFDSHLGREIAVKELLAAGAATGRFLREARVTAQLEHPNIVPVYELGRRADGTLYYTMKRVRGRTLADALADADTLEDRLLLLGHFVSVCQAVAYAHSRGVVHRDLKPQNVMVGEFGETVLLDWGLAKVRGQQDLRGSELEREVQLLRGADAHHTLEGATMGTPAYMSPEQANGRIDQIDERSDVWSLGAVLFEILTGVPPFVGRTPMETLAKVIHEPSPRADEAPLELAHVCTKALQRDPADRYQSARELAGEILAWQAGGRVSAHSYTPWELTRKFVARHRAIVTVATLGVAALLGVSSLAAAQIIRQRDRALVAEAATAAQLAHSLTGQSLAALRVRDLGAAWTLAAGALDIAETPEARGALLAAASGWLPELVATEDVEERCHSVAYSPDGTTLAVMARTGAYLRRVGAERLSKLDMQGDAALAVAFTRDGSQVLTAHAAGTLLVWDPTGGVVARLGAEGDGIRWLVGVPGTNEAVTSGFTGAIRVWDLPKRRLRLRLTGHTRGVDTLAVSADGRLLASGSTDQTIRLWDLARGTALGVIPESALTLAFSPDGRHLASGGDSFGGDGRVHLWDVATRAPVTTLSGHDGEVMSVSWSPDGTLLAAAFTDGTVGVWDGATYAPLASLDTYTLAARGLAFSPDSRHLAVVAGDGRILEWALPPGHRTGRYLGHTRAVYGVFFADEGHVVSVGEDARVVRWDLDRGEAERVRDVPDRGGRSAALFSDGAAVAVGVEEQGVWVIPFEGEPRRWDTPTTPSDLAISDTRVAVALDDVLQLRDLDGLVLAESPRLDALLSGLALRGDRVLTSSYDGRLRLYDDVTEVARSRPLDTDLGKPSFSPDGTRVAAGERRGPVRTWRLPGLVEEHRLEGPTDWSVATTFSPDGRVLASASWDGTVRLWDPVAGRALAVLPGHGNLVHAVAFSPSGATLASVGADRTVALWRLARLHDPAATLLAEAESRFGIVLDGADLALGR